MPAILARSKNFQGDVEMKRAIRNQIEQMIDEESQKPVDEELLNQLRKFASEKINHADTTPEKRNALNVFMQEVKELMYRELLTGDYGADIIVDSMLVVSFESGRKLGHYECQPPVPSR